MDRAPVASSNLASIGYDGDSFVLEVEFKDGSVYQYFDVPVSEYDQLMGAGSIGGYFVANIRNAYRNARL